MNEQEFEAYMRILEFKKQNAMLLQSIADNWNSGNGYIITFIAIFGSFLLSLIFGIIKKFEDGHGYWILIIILGIATFISGVAWGAETSYGIVRVMCYFASK